MRRAAGCFGDFLLSSFQLTSKDLNGFDIIQFAQPRPKRRKRSSEIYCLASRNVVYFISRDLTWFDSECNPQGDALCWLTG